MDKTARLNILLKKYVETDNEEFRRAKRLVADRQKIQEEIKKTMKALGITEHRLENEQMEAHISYNITQYECVDVDVLPDDIKVPYLKKVDIWRETLNVAKKN
jgi:hypothetical protein